MGMLGAMAGFGQGLQDYSKMLNEKAKQDFASQQAEIQFERQKNLENLRATNQKDYATFSANEQMRVEKEMAPERLQQKKEEIGAQAQAKADWTPVAINVETGAPIYAKDIDKVDRSKVKTLSQQEMDDYRQKKEIDTSQAIALQERVLSLQGKERDRIKKDVLESDVYKNSDPETKKMIEMSVQSPEAFKVFAEIHKAKGKEAMPFEQWRMAYENGIKNYDTLDDASKKTVTNQARSFFGDKNITEDKVKEYYGTQQASIVSSRGGLLSGPSSPPLSMIKDERGLQNAVAKINSLSPEEQKIALSQLEPNSRAKVEERMRGKVSGEGSSMFVESDQDTGLSRSIEGMKNAKPISINTGLSGALQRRRATGDTSPWSR